MQVEHLAGTQVRRKLESGEKGGLIFSPMHRSLFLILLLTVASCTGDGTDLPESLSAGAGVYFWKTTLDLSAEDVRQARQTGFSQLFLRITDLDWDYNRKSINPKGELRISTTTDTGDLPVTPVLYLVNRVLREHEDPAALGKRIGRYFARFQADHPAMAFSGRWQIDCDWTPGTRDAYFSLLRALKVEHPEVVLSVTVRLHQYRERIKNGVPPADEGLLMCYNLTPVDDISTPNSIFDLALLRGYLKAPAYPLTLDAALPVFEWGAAFRNGKLTGIVVSPEELSGHLLKVGPGRYLVESETISQGTLLRPGDDLRYDGPGDAAVLQQAFRILRDKSDVRNIHYFDWTPPAWKKFGISNLIGP